MKSVSVAALLALVVAAASLALAGVASANAAPKTCGDWHHYGKKVDYYATHIEVTDVSCRVAASFAKSDLKLANWHVAKHEKQASPVETIYAITAHDGSGKITLYWTVLRN